MKDVTTHFEWNYTSILNVIFLGIFAVLYLLYRNRDRLGGGHGYAIDPVCGMQVETATAPASTVHDGHAVFFCSDRCEEKFTAKPSKFLDPNAPAEGMAGPALGAGTGQHALTLQAGVDPVCGMAVDTDTAPAHRRYAGRHLAFCSSACASRFDADPARWAGPTTDMDPVCGMAVLTSTAAVRRTHDDTEVFFCGTGCADRFDGDPATFTAASHPSP